jgi:hypothetical protein
MTAISSLSVRFDRAELDVGERLRELLWSGALELALPGRGDTAGRWAALAGWAAQDLALARLIEGHTDAVAILAEAGRQAAPGRRYGVWAARSGGTGAELSGRTLHGRVRFCSGAGLLDRALVVAGDQVLDIPLDAPGVHVDEDSWAADGMRASRTLDVHFDAVEVSESALVGPPSFYTCRPGFDWGGAGVAAVWLGGATALLRHTAARLSNPDPHQLAHLGALHTATEAADAVLTRLAARIDNPSTVVPARIDAAAIGSRTDIATARATVRAVGDSREGVPTSQFRDGAPSVDTDLRVDVATARAAVESACRQTLDVLPRLAGVPALSGDRWLSRHLADLAVYLRQHHGERDLAQLGALLLDR